MTRRLDAITEENLKEFVPLYLSVFNAPPWNDGWSVAAAEERLSTFARYPGFLGLGLWQEGVPTALALGWTARWVDSWHFHLKEMCVAPPHQRTGLGRELLEALESALEQRGIASVFLETRAGSPASSFYAMNGYKKSKLITMTKRLRA